MVNEEIVTEIKKKLKANQLIFGSRRCQKEMKLGKLDKILLASNCPETTVSDVEHCAKMVGLEVVKLDTPNDELGVLCKRQHNISVLALLK